MKAHFEMFAAYNAWANRRLYDAAAAMDDGQRKRDVGAVFGSLHGTLNHLIVTDRIWMRRFTGEGPEHKRLDEVPYPDFDELRAAREVEDERLIGFAASVTPEALAADFSYVRTSTPEPITQPLGPAVAHLFNHQTHHRGQCHHMITAAGGEAPPLDLAFYQRGAALMFKCNSELGMAER